MFLKAITQSWAKSKLEKETAHTQSLISELDRAKEEANTRDEAKRGGYLHKIKAHQEKRNNELKIYIDFMNDQLKIAGAYLPELNQFQNLTFACVDSWIHVDLCQQEINIISQKLNAIKSTLGLFDAYVSELTKQSQRQECYAWREFMATRQLTVENDFVDKAKKIIERASKNSDDEFKNELMRLKSHRAALFKEANALRTERSALLKNKKDIDGKHDANKKALVDKYNACVESWSVIARKFEDYYAYEPTENYQANEWLRGLENGGTLSEIMEVLRMATESIKSANQALFVLNNEYQPYKRRIQVAHETKDYPDTFADDNAMRKRLAPAIKEAIENKNTLVEARTILFTRRDKLQDYIDRIKPLHPDAVVESLCEMLNVDSELNTWFAFGFNTKNQRREHWEKKQKRIENATTN
jgi:hypothetical protein